MAAGGKEGFAAGAQGAEGIKGVYRAGGLSITIRVGIAISHVVVLLCFCGWMGCFLWPSAVGCADADGKADAKKRERM